eukprot:m.116164 g.116164  ORF g.116164 m.116164 type:complete len:632 (+) comp15390_c0_seq3:65-1960(+)
MTSQFIANCKVLFNRADEDGNGCLDADEFKAVLESDTLKLNLSPDEIAQVVESSVQDGEGISLAEFIPVVQALFFRHRAKTAALKRTARSLPPLQRHRVKSALERSIRSRTLSTRATPTRPHTTMASPHSPPATPAQRRWGMIRSYVEKGAAERALAIPDYIETLDFATLTKLVFGATRPSESDVWNLRRQANEAARQNNNGKAETLYKFAVKLAEGLTHKQETQVLLGLTALGDVQVKLEKYHDAIATLRRCLQIRKAAIVTDKAAILHCLVELCLCSLALRRTHDGIKYGLEAHDYHAATNARITSSPARWKEFLLKLAEALTVKGHYKKAMEIQEQATAVLLKQVDKSSKEASHVITSLAFVSQVAHASGMSRLEEEYCRAPTLSNPTPEQTQELKDLLHANTMYSLGRMMLQQKQASEALPLLQQSLATFTKIHGRKHPRVGFALASLASCYALAGTQKMLRRALSLLEKAATVITSSLGPDCEALAEPGGPLPVRAQIEEMLGQLQAARRLWHAVAQNRLRHTSNTHPSYLEALEQKERVSKLLTQKRPLTTMESLLKMYQDKQEEHLNTCIVCGVKTDAKVCQACSNARKLQQLSRYRYMQDGTNHPRLWSRYVARMDELAPPPS